MYKRKFFHPYWQPFYFFLLSVLLSVQVRVLELIKISLRFLKPSMQTVWLKIL